MRTRHSFTTIAPEANPEGLSEKYLNTWRWCIRCGVLKLGHQYFVQGPLQTMTIKPVKGKAPPCV